MAHPRIPLIRLDAGWLFILAGLATCIGCVLVAADNELQMLRVQRSLLNAEEQTAYARIRAHEDFLAQLEHPDEALTRRLAASELNLMPADEEPVLRMVSFEVPTIEWIDRQVAHHAPQPVLASHSMLTQLATGRYRLWLFGAGVMSVFVGLLLDPSASSVRRRRVAVMPMLEVDRVTIKAARDTLAVGAALIEPEVSSGEAAAAAPASTDECTSFGEKDVISDEDDVDAEAYELDEFEDDELAEVELLAERADEREFDDTAEDGAGVEFQGKPTTDDETGQNVLSIRPSLSVAPPVEDDEELAQIERELAHVEMIASEDAVFAEEFDCVDEMPEENWDADVPPDDEGDDDNKPAPKKRTRSRKKR